MGTRTGAKPKRMRVINAISINYFYFIVSVFAYIYGNQCSECSLKKNWREGNVSGSEITRGLRHQNEH